MENSLVNTPESVSASESLRPFAREKARWFGDYPLLLRTIGLGVLFVLLCAPIFGDLWNLWWNRYGFSHGFLVPLVSLYLVWLRRPTLRQIPVKPAFVPGLLWLVVATVLLLVS